MVRAPCRSGEHLTGSSDLTNQSGAHPTASGKCEKLYNHPNRCGGITTHSGILHSVYSLIHFIRHQKIANTRKTFPSKHGNVTGM